MKLSKEQEKALLDVYHSAKEKNEFVETSKAQLKAHRKAKRDAYLQNKHIIDEVFYHEMARA